MTCLPDAFSDSHEPPLWGEATRRAMRTFAISRERIDPELIQALAHVKAACARANVAIGALCTSRGEAIQAAAHEVATGLHAAQFPLTVWQSAAGAQTDANMNEVLARRAGELLAGSSGLPCAVDAERDVGLGHGPDDALPAATHVAALGLVNQRLLPALARLRGTLAVKAHYFRDLSAPARARVAPGTSLGQVFGALETRLASAQHALEAARGPLHELALGAGAGNAGDERGEFAALACTALAEALGQPLRPATDRVAALGRADAPVALHGALKYLALTLTQLARDVDALDLVPPDAEPACTGVEPALGEALAMAGAQVVGNDAALSAAAAGGALHGAAARPLVAHLLVQGALLLADAMQAFDAHLVRGLSAPAPSSAALPETSAERRAPYAVLRESAPEIHCRQRAFFDE